MDVIMQRSNKMAHREEGNVIMQSVPPIWQTGPANLREWGDPEWGRDFPVVASTC